MTTPASLNPDLLDGWISTAQALAARAHAGQTRRGGTPYLEHPAAVAAKVPPVLRPIAWLHDVCEDSDLTPEDLRAAGLPEYVVLAVEAITKQSDEAYESYLERVLANPEAPEFATLQAELATPGMPKPLESELIDLLNFLEFVSGLTRRGLVARRDIDWMFASYIERVVAVDFVRAYILRQDFEELSAEARQAEKAK